MTENEYLLDATTDERWKVQDRLLDEIVQHILGLPVEVGVSGIDRTKVMKFLTERRLQLGVEYGRITPNEARTLLGVPEWAQ